MALSADWVRPSRYRQITPMLLAGQRASARWRLPLLHRKSVTQAETGPVVQSLYACISGNAGAPRDWELHDTLFAPGAHSYVLHPLADGDYEAEVLTQSEYRATRQPYFETNDFFEVEVDHRAEIRGDTALVFSEYESRRSPDGPAFDRGVNTIMMIRLHGEWKITGIAWKAGPIATALWKERSTSTGLGTERD
jgi:hypothetical protein